MASRGSLYSILTRPCEHLALTCFPQTPAYVKESSSDAADESPKTHGPESTYFKDTNSIQYTTVNKFPAVRLLPNSERKRILVTGGAGFVGSHLVDRLMLLGHEVTVLDNFFTGSRTTVRYSDERCYDNEGVLTQRP